MRHKNVSRYKDKFMQYAGMGGGGGGGTNCSTVLLVEV
jgi:hypothetical protein